LEKRLEIPQAQQNAIRAESLYIMSFHPLLTKRLLDWDLPPLNTNEETEQDMAGQPALSISTS